MQQAKVSVFNKDTGKFEVYAARNASRVVKLEAGGAYIVEGKYDRTVKYDIPTGQIVPDNDNLNEIAAKEQRRANVPVWKEELKSLKGNAAQQQRAIDLLIDLTVQ